VSFHNLDAIAVTTPEALLSSVTPLNDADFAAELA
jgi:hypothetical protein